MSGGGRSSQRYTREFKVYAVKQAVESGLAKVGAWRSTWWRGAKSRIWHRARGSRNPRCRSLRSRAQWRTILRCSFSGLELPSPAYIFGAIVFGLIGLGAFRRGCKSGRRPTLWLGVALMVYPYAISRTWLRTRSARAACGPFQRYD